MTRDENSRDQLGEFPIIFLIFLLRYENGIRKAGLGKQNRLYEISRHRKRNASGVCQ